PQCGKLGTKNLPESEPTTRLAPLVVAGRSAGPATMASSSAISVGPSDAPMNVDFGVEVTRAFDRSGEVYPTETPAGEVAMAIHMGGDDRLRETHDAMHEWAAADQRLFGGASWGIYGEWWDDPSSR